MVAEELEELVRGAPWIRQPPVLHDLARVSSMNCVALIVVVTQPAAVQLVPDVANVMARLWSAALVNDHAAQKILRPKFETQIRDHAEAILPSLERRCPPHRLANNLSPAFSPPCWSSKVADCDFGAAQRK
eukprot:65212-Pyramimonas_sp.AAC.1